MNDCIVKAAAVEGYTRVNVNGVDRTLGKGNVDAWESVGDQTLGRGNVNDVVGPPPGMVNVTYEDLENVVCEDSESMTCEGFENAHALQ